MARNLVNVSSKYGKGEMYPIYLKQQSIRIT